MQNKVITFTIFMEPVAKGRPRFGRGRTYTPEKTRTAEDEIRWHIIRMFETFAPCYEKGVPLKLEAVFYKTRPKRLPKRICLPTGKPDIDNLLKALVDAMAGLLFLNDSQITSVTARKRYGDPPRIEVSLREDTIEQEEQ